ncbi:MAG: hypothetical protein ACM3NH_01760 [Candidatus Saccharibacteria bacterium]
MDIDRWEGLKEEIRRKFTVEEEKTEDLMVETNDGLIKQGTAEVLVFESPLGRMKLSMEKRPVVVDKKFIYSHRAGQAARTEYTFSDSEFSYTMKAYKWDDDNDDWTEIDVANFQ